MQPEEFDDFRISFDASEEECRKILAEYFHLSKLSSLNDQQAARIGYIIQMAEFDDRMAILINEIDEISFQEFDFYGEECQTCFANESAMSQEYILSENERHFLMRFSAVGQRESYESESGSLFPRRVEMLYDHTHSLRMSLDKTFFLDPLPGEPGVSSVYTTDSGMNRRQRIIAKIKSLLKRFLRDKMMSWLMSVALVCLVFLIAV